jgi:diadenosine tetraphosphate (Ap4A) HIT family hydrolase
MATFERGGNVDCVNCGRWRERRPSEAPVGGLIYEDEHWYAYHAPVGTATLGQLFLVSKRHFLDLTEMTPEEASTYGAVLSHLCAALKGVVHAERVYTIVTVEGVPHFHTWLIPRTAGAAQRGWALITSTRSCSEDDALRVVTALRSALEEIPATSGSD